MISLLLLRQIARMFVYILMGWLLVKSHLVKSSDSRVLSVLSLYLMTPCVTIASFQMEVTTELLLGLLLSVGTAILIYLLVFAASWLLRPLHLTAVKKASVIYSNAGNMVIPLVSAIFGPEWVIYTCTFVGVRTVLLWSHGRMLISGERTFSSKKLLLHVNILSIVAGLALFLLRIPLPGVLLDPVSALGNMVGPTCMLVTGMLLGGMELRSLVQTKGVWRVAFLRLVAVPLLVTLVLKCSGLAALLPDGEAIVLISLLAIITPSAPSVTQLAQIYCGDDMGAYAGTINVVTTLLCIVTMPLMVAIFQL